MGKLVFPILVLTALLTGAYVLFVPKEAAEVEQLDRMLTDLEPVMKKFASQATEEPLMPSFDKLIRFMEETNQVLATHQGQCNLAASALQAAQQRYVLEQARLLKSRDQFVQEMVNLGPKKLRQQSINFSVRMYAVAKSLMPRVHAFAAACPDQKDFLKGLSQEATRQTPMDGFFKQGAKPRKGSGGPCPTVEDPFRSWSCWRWSMPCWACGWQPSPWPRNAPSILASTRRAT